MAAFSPCYLTEKSLRSDDEGIHRATQEKVMVLIGALGRGEPIAWGFQSERHAGGASAPDRLSDRIEYPIGLRHRAQSISSPPGRSDATIVF
jgi:hypothetical protein